MNNYSVPSSPLTFLPAKGTNFVPNIMFLYKPPSIKIAYKFTYNFIGKKPWLVKS